MVILDCMFWFVLYRSLEVSSLANRPTWTHCLMHGLEPWRMNSSTLRWSAMVHTLILEMGTEWPNTCWWSHSRLSQCDTSRWAPCMCECYKTTHWSPSKFHILNCFIEFISIVWVEPHCWVWVLAPSISASVDLCAFFTRSLEVYSVHHGVSNINYLVSILSESLHRDHLRVREQLHHCHIQACVWLVNLVFHQWPVPRLG